MNCLQRCLTAQPPGHEPVDQGARPQQVLQHVVLREGAQVIAATDEDSNSKSELE